MVIAVLPPYLRTLEPTIKCTVEHFGKNGVPKGEIMPWFMQHFLLRALPIMQRHNISKYAVVSEIACDDILSRCQTGANNLADGFSS